MTKEYCKVILEKIRRIQDELAEIDLNWDTDSDRMLGSAYMWMSRLEKRLTVKLRSMHEE